MAIDMDDIGNITTNVLQWFKHFQFGNKQQLAFLEDFSVLINDGIPPNRAIDMMTQVSKGISRDVAISIATRISEGQPLAEGMRDWFAPNIVEIVRVGEEGGALNETIKSGINTLSQKSGVMNAFIAAISYPLLVISICCILIVYMNDSIFVQFRSIKPESQWPAAGQQFVTVAHLIESWWWVVLTACGIIIFMIRRILTNYIGELRGTLDAIPPFNLYRRFVAARFLETLGLLVSNGVVFKQALKVMQYQANPYLASHLVMMEHLLSTGKGNVADVLDTGLVDESDNLRLRVMAEVKGFEHGLVRMGVRGSEQVTLTMKTISKVFGSLLLVVGGILIIVIIRGIYLTGMSMGAG